jgi:hypothetical protein
MRSKIRSYRPSHAVVVAYLALFVALGGSSYAAIKVTGKNVKNSSLTGKDVKNDSLKGADVTGLGTGDIRDSSLLAQDFKPGQLPAGAQGPKGADGPRGPEGPEGPGGDDGTALGYAHIDTEGTIDPERSKNVVRSVTFFESGSIKYCIEFAGTVRNAVASPTSESTPSKASVSLGTVPDEPPCRFRDIPYDVVVITENTGAMVLVN